MPAQSILTVIVAYSTVC